MLDVAIPIGDLGGLQGFPLFLQMTVQSPVDGALLGSPTAVVLLDDMF